MQNDRKIHISTAGSRKAVSWPTSVILWSELVKKLETPTRGAETLEEYLKLSKAKQDDLKDVGGFVAGELESGRRKAGSVLGRDVLSLDMDNIPTGGTQTVIEKIDELQCGYCAYSTRKHHQDKPRLRILIPLAQTITADEYEPVARKTAERIGMAMCDPSTFEVSRLMYWPSCCLDSDYIYKYSDMPMLDADSVLAQYEDWRNVSSWPQVPGAPQQTANSISRQADPTEKPGVVGAFCKVYNIYEVLDKYLDGVYESCGEGDRFTYKKGSTTGGAIIYDGGNFLFSHHATDPCGGRLVNAFDLVRLHQFGELDNDAKPDTPVNKLPSYINMCELAVADERVIAVLNAERYEKAVEVFEKVSDETDTDWLKNLEVNGQGIPTKTLKNYKMILINDPQLKNKIRLNLFTGRIDVRGVLPWLRQGGRDTWGDADTTQLRVYLEPLVGKTTKNDVADAVDAVADELAYHPVRDYLMELKWDGLARLDKLFIDYLGAAEDDYIRAVTRKSLVAAVARIMIPGIKYDIMPVLIGAQGRHKSSILAKLGGEWFSDSLRSFDGKDAMETIQGTWINEISEMQAMERSEVNAVKAFLSKTSDYYRAAYGRYTLERERQCVFFGTTNSKECLRDTTGGRRFWPIDIDAQKRSKDVFKDLDAERDQIWAEAVHRFRLGETLYLDSELETKAREHQEEHRERHPWEDMIVEFVERKIPADWVERNLDSRIMYWSGHDHRAGVKLVERDMICVFDIWCELLGRSKSDINQRISREINSILERLEGWERAGRQPTGEAYGRQRVFIKTDSN